ncbi:hypothetical protein L3081_02275 [Colwellia sp. MSW7]|uniref:DUF3325 domain-containing protein n=1 Tax=Colwellia maritima TaxID=2912588 RepID=A0ABS9WWU1_9GAMM|nr:hypothetical protein [Colwellia maritima]MCI2282434.1 hypothetical protein [Colwellia maritima]
MSQFIALMITLIGATFIYLSNKHQTIFSKPLNKFWRLIGLVLCLLALFVWLQIFVTSSAVFIWLFTLNIVLVCIPLMTLIPLFSKIER